MAFRSSKFGPEISRFLDETDAFTATLRRPSFFTIRGVFHGEGWNCDSIELRHALDCEDAIELFVRGRWYQTGPEGKRVTPYGIYVIPKSLKKLIVKEDCQGLLGCPPVWTIVGESHPVGGL